MSFEHAPFLAVGVCYLSHKAKSGAKQQRIQKTTAHTEEGSW